MTDKILLIDGNNLTLRAMHASPDLRDEEGNPTGCLFVSLRSLIRICDELRPDMVLWFWDRGHSEYRLQIYPDYKKRKERPVEFDQFYSDWKQQVAYLEQYLPYLGVGQIAVAGCEADDLISFVGRELILGDDPMDTERVIIASSDKDFYQLIDENINIYNLTRGDASPGGLIGYLEFKDLKGFSPENWLFFRAMTGDGSDNIPGVPGIGDARATSIVQEFHSLDRLSQTPDRNLSKFPKLVKDNLGIVKRNFLLMDLHSLLSLEYNQKLTAENQFNQALKLEPDHKTFWNLCSQHNMLKLLEDKYLWKYTSGAIHGDSIGK